MKIKLIIISIILLLVMLFVCGCIPFMEKLGLVSPTNEEQLSPEKSGPPDGLVKVLIGFKEKPGAAEQALVNSMGGKIKYTYNFIPAMAASIPEKAIEALKKNPNITEIEMDTKVYAFQETTSNWGIEAIGADIAHANGHDGNGIEVAVIDTGIDDSHSELEVHGGYDFVNLDDDPADDNGHGTHVAGIIAAQSNNIGIASGVNLYALKALDSEGVGYVSDIIFAIQWASDPDGDGSASDRLDIINMSFGANVSNIFLKWACNLAYRDGLLLVASAGNEYGGPVGYPAAYNRVIAVSAIDKNKHLADFSSTGSEVELAAPGVDIYSTLPTYECTLSSEYGYIYGVLSGTSMACPHVVGTAALVWADNTSWSNKDVRARLQNTAEDIGLLSTEQGYGLVDAAKAVGVDTDTTPPAEVTDLTVSTVSWAQLDLVWNANTEEDLDHYNVYRSTTSGGLYDLVALPTTNSYLDVGLTASTTYYYVVAAVDNSGNEGEASDEAVGTTSADDLLGPVTSDVVADPNPTNGATPVTLTAVVSDATTGDSNITQVEYFVDTVGTGGSGTSMSASNGTFDSPTEGVTASIDVFGWTVGQHTLHVHGMDAAGNWGITESVMLDVTEASSNATMYVSNIDIKFKNAFAGPNTFYTAIATVTIFAVDTEGNPLSPVEGATVSGTWSGATTDTDSGVTDANGKVSLQSNKLKNPGSGTIFTFTVDNVTKDGWEYNNPEGTETSGSITVP